MKIKLYKGPMHGKVYNVPDDQTSVVVTHRADKNTRRENHSFEPVETVSHRTLRYSMQMMSGNVGGRQFSGPSVHPDGSVFFTYDGEA